MTETFYISKYALSIGIVKVRGRRTETSNGVSVCWAAGWSGQAHFYKEEWHTTLDAAQTQATKMRAGKIKSLQKQLAKLQAATSVKVSDRTALRGAQEHEAAPN